jgi:capsular polysaccharide export protein
MPIKSIQSNLKTRINWDLKYHIGNYFNKQKFSYYQHHRGDKIWQEYLGWSKRFGINFFIGKQNIKKNLKSFENKEYFLVPLQLSCDFQISHHSYYRNTQEMVAEVITSFEIHAKKDTHLVFKIHPFDTLILNNIKYIKKLIKNNTFLKHRVTILDGGHLPTLIDNAQGVIVINSTVGLQALYHQAPTKALGNAIYNFEGLTDQKPLNEFWQNPSKPDTELFKKFRTHLLHHNQINGGFYSLDGIKTAAPIVAEKMHKAQMLQ